MADDLPDAPWVGGGAQANQGGSDLPDAPWVMPKMGVGEAAVAPITHLPGAYSDIVNQSVEQMKRGVGQISSGQPWEIAKGVGNVGLGGLGYVTAPINAPLRTFVGEPTERATGSPLAGTLAEAGASFALPVPKGLPRFRDIPIPAESPYGITLSQGERTGDMAARQAEQAAIRGGEPVGQAWQAQRAAQMEQARTDLAAGLDPQRQIIAETPQEAGALASQAVRSQAAQSKAAVNAAYKEAREMGGVLDAGVFRKMPDNIRTDLAAGDNPIIIDPHTTPNAAKMLDFIQGKVGPMDNPNIATPNWPPKPTTQTKTILAGPGYHIADDITETPQVTGVNLQGVDQWRKALSGMRRDAMANPGDARAARAVLDAFDDRIDQAVNSNRFTGDRSAVNAWNNARAAYSDYRSTYTAQKNDPVGRVVQKIIGDNINDPLTPTKVMDQIVGSSGVAPSPLNIGVANRLKSIMGESSPEWVAVKQGVLQRLIGSGEGEATLGTGQTAQRLSKFLNGDMASVMYSPKELDTLRGYANLMRQITMPPGTYFPSAPGIAKIGSVIANRVGAIAGALIGRAVTPGIPLVGELAGLKAGSVIERTLEKAHTNVAKQLPIVSQQWNRWSRAQSDLATRPSGVAQRAAAAATINLQKAVAPLGIDLKALAGGSGPAEAQPQQNNIPGSVQQQNRGGAVQRQPRARGGQVKPHKADGGATDSDDLDFSNKYNTPLSPADENQFQKWTTAQSNSVGRDLSKDNYDYDLRGWWKANNGAPLTGGHLTDQFKKPNHPTFSDQSQYSGTDGMQGGHWQKQQGSWSFTPGPTNMFSTKELQNYFEKNEPGNILNLQNPNLEAARARANTENAFGLNEIQRATGLNLSPFVGIGDLYQPQIPPERLIQEDFRQLPGFFKSGGTVSNKITKKAADYRGGVANRRCQLCSMFRKPASCTAVKGQISPWAVCRLFERKKT